MHEGIILAKGVLLSNVNIPRITENLRVNYAILFQEF